ncbi:LPXTG cell wall anchor domain-containing protein, partial [Bacillus sonorensis]
DAPGGGSHNGGSGNGSGHDGGNGGQAPADPANGSLPNTATTFYNWLMLGLLLLAAGGGLYLYQRKKRNINHM